MQIILVYAVNKIVERAFDAPELTTTTNTKRSPTAPYEYATTTH